MPAPGIAGSSALYGSIGVVFATLAWLAIYARLIVYGAALNVVQYEAHAGTVTELEVAPGTTVAMDQVLAVIAPAATEEETA